MHLKRVEKMILRFVNVTSARWWKRTTARRGRLLSLDPTSKKTVSSSRLITVLASKQPALLRDFKGCTGAGGVAIAKACTGGREGGERKGEREREREKGEMKGYRGSNCAYVSTSWPIQLSIGWQRRILNGTHTHPNHTCSVYFRLIQLRPRDSSTKNYIISTYRYISIYILTFPMWCSTRKNKVFRGWEKIVRKIYDSLNWTGFA